MSDKSKRNPNKARPGNSNAKGKHWNLSTETRKRMSIAKTGSGNNLWKGGVSEENHSVRNGIEIRLWRESVFTRDAWTCQKCFTQGCALQAHHILNFSERKDLRFAIDNGITLCVGCHTDFHNEYGRSGNDVEQITEFICGKNI